MFQKKKIKINISLEAGRKFPSRGFPGKQNNTDLYGLHGTRMLAHIQQKCMYKCSEIRKSCMQGFVTMHLRGGVSLQFTQRAK